MSRFAALVALAAALHPASPAHAAGTAAAAPRAPAPRTNTYPAAAARRAPAASYTAAVDPDALANEARQLLRAGDYLGFRVFIRKAYYRRLNYREWSGLKDLVNANAAAVGYDLIYIWNARNETAKSTVDQTMEYADKLMLSGNFRGAFDEYQKMARYVKRLQAAYKSRRVSGDAAVEAQKQKIQELDSLYQFILHSMGRALYGAGRYEEALTVYRWIKPGYARFRQVLFEKMWAAFRAGRVEESLGAIASQRSDYFSRYISPEAYLIQTYIYRKLCRDKDLESVINDMKRYEAHLRRPEAAAQWAGNDLETRVLWSLSKATIVDAPSSMVTHQDREQERRYIEQNLQKSFQAHRARLLSDLKTALAYAQLANMKETSTALKPVKKLNSREELARQNLEIWPADSAEEWADEVGTHQFIGASECGGQS